MNVRTDMIRQTERQMVHLALAIARRILQREVSLDPDLLLAMAGKVSGELQEVIRRRPVLFSQLLRELRDLPDDAVVRLVREVRDGEW